MTLSKFKRHIENAKVNGLFMKSKVVNPKGEVVKENDFAPVKHTQTNAFALLRNEKLSWVEYGKASEWEFENSQAIRKYKDGGKLILEFNDLSFF